MTRWTRLRVAAEAEDAVYRLLVASRNRRVGLIADRLADVPQSAIIDVADAIAVRLAQVVEAGTELSPRFREHVRDEELGHRDPFGRAL